MSALPGDVDQTIVNDQRRDESRAGGFSIPVQFLGGTVLCAADAGVAAVAAVIPAKPRPAKSAAK